MLRSLVACRDKSRDIAAEFLDSSNSTEPKEQAS